MKRAGLQRVAASQLFGLVSAGLVVAAGGWLFIAGYARVSHSALVLQAAKLGRLERHDTPWVVVAIVLLMAAFTLILAASAYGRRQRLSGTLRWSLTAAAIVLALAPGAAYGLLAGPSAAYAGAQEYGVVSPGGVTRYPWGQAVAAEIACEPQRTDRAIVRFRIAFADGRHDQFSFILQRGVASDMIDWDLWLAYQIRGARRNLPDLKPDPACDALVYDVAPPGFQAKYRQLFTPAGR